MKKLIALLLVLTMAMGLVACGNNGEGEGTTTGEAVAVPESALEILETVWGSYAEDEKFFAMGGDYTNPVDNAPGNYSLEDAEAVTAALLVPADQIANIDEAASLMHAMMANNFTCGVFHVTGDATAFADAMYNAISTNPWMCGMPEKMIIAVIGGEYVLASFGINDAMGNFETKLTAAYPDAELKYNEDITG
ncbi:MAG: hypothetical protein IKL38_07945 [Firmicutes bacterium]|nr:hypothetical protein [Bacillota bacterium]